MVKIRYAELPAGLHVATEKHDGHTIVYLQPGLTPGQRRAALAFARCSARVGQGPSLPAAEMVSALAADRVRTTCGNFVAALRRHPVLLLPLVGVLSAMIVISMLSVVTVRFGPTRVPGVSPVSQRGGARATKPGGSATPSAALVPHPSATGSEVPASALTDTPSAGYASAPTAAPHLCFKLGDATLCMRP